MAEAVGSRTQLRSGRVRSSAADRYDHEIIHGPGLAVEQTILDPSCSYLGYALW